MADISTQEKRIFGVKQTADFSNPIVRFRRIKGRVVPILNRKRVGGGISKAGGTTMKVGAAMGAVGLAKRAYKKYHASDPVSKKIRKAAPKVKIKGKYIRKAVKGIAKAPFKHTGKIGMGLLLGGAAMKVMGFRMQADSEVGYDI